MSNRHLVLSAFAAAIAAPALAPPPAAAQVPVPAPQFAAEKCYGLARAGKNDCASTGNNSCGGTSRRDSDPAAWIYVPQGLCERIVGGSLQPRRG